MAVKNLTTDVFIIGGGINGAGIARDLAGRGLSVVLVDQGDLAGATSSASSKIIHGGLRYLEHKDFKLVRESLGEREVLMKSAPHLITPMNFVLPHNNKQRPYWLIRLGVYLYDFLAPRKVLPMSKGINVRTHRLGIPLKNHFRRGIVYPDCWTDDARLVVINAMDAREKGAQIFTRMKCKAARKKRGHKVWRLTCEDQITRREMFVDAKCVINAGGPWAGKIINGIDPKLTQYKTRLVKGSHIIVPKMYDGEHAYTLQNDDGRVIFTFPYQNKFTLIGTTDVEYRGNPADVKISREETVYLCRAVNRYFKQKITPDRVIASYSGVRSLFDDGEKDAKSVTRDYVLEVNKHEKLPVISVLGGKLTSYRKVAEEVGNKVVRILGRGKDPWTKDSVLPGGDINTLDANVFFKNFSFEYGWLPPEIAQRYCKTYGTLARYFLRGAKRISDLGAHLGDGVYEAEIAYLVMKEWAMTLEDILWRRTKLGLFVSEDTISKIEKTLRKYKKRFSPPSGRAEFNKVKNQ